MKKIMNFIGIVGIIISTICLWICVFLQLNKLWLFFLAIWIVSAILAIGSWYIGE